MRLGMRGRAALVTGAAGGIGRAVAEHLAAEHVRVALADLDTAAVQAAAARLSDAGAEASGFGFDVTDESQVATTTAAVIDRFGGLDLLICCAGISGPVGTRLDETSLAEWNAVFAVNVSGSFLMLKHAVPALQASDAASIVLVASDSAVVAAPGMAAYCASKGALVQLARAAAVELAGSDIRVNAVCPSIVDTPMSRHDLGNDGGFAGAPYPVQTADEVAAQVLFLSSPRSRPINAASVLSDFGYSARSNFPA